MLLVQRVGMSQMLEASKFGFVLQLEFPYSAPIPFAPLSITEEISKPNDEVADIDEEGEEYSVYCKRGKRGSMEDRYSAVVDLQGDTKQLERITNLQIICVIKHKTTVSEYEVTEAVREGYLATDSEFLNEDINGGTCCVTALIRKGNLIVSNAGDCRAVMSRGGVAEALAVDHKPSRNDEKDRIEPMIRFGSVLPSFSIEASELQLSRAGFGYLFMGAAWSFGQMVLEGVDEFGHNLSFLTKSLTENMWSMQQYADT
ncbi:hypothetical protein LXL04_023728 [Taraxacum kok-saghyz]